MLRFTLLSPNILSGTSLILLISEVSPWIWHEYLFLLFSFIGSKSQFAVLVNVSNTLNLHLVVKMEVKFNFGGNT